MAITLKDVAELEAKVASNRKKLEDQEAALRVLKSMISESELKSTTAKQINLIDLPPSSNAKKSLTARVREIILQIGSQEFTVAQIESVLKERGGLPKSKTPRASIAQALQKLEINDEIVRAFKGTGNEPHRYKQAKNASGMFE